MATTSLGVRVRETMTQIVRIPSVSHKEAQVREHLKKKLKALGLSIKVDPAGNLIAFMKASDPTQSQCPLLLNAHMDRVPPGAGCEPTMREGQMFSDGATNLGADDAAGLTIVLLVLEELRSRKLSHGPLLILFTVAEEVGLVGASKFDPGPWNVSEGIIFDNAGDPGDVVTRGSAYIAFDITLHGHGGHPGKDLAGTASAIDMFRIVSLSTGELDGGLTRLSLGTISGGSARNAIADNVVIRGELRTLLGARDQERLCHGIETAFVEAARKLGGMMESSFVPLAAAYEVSEDEPLLRAFGQAWESMGQRFRTMSTFVASDANALRNRLRVFTISTGVTNEHTVMESVALDPLASLINATVELVSTYRSLPN